MLDAYAQRDAERARAVWERDAELDALEDSVFRDLLTHMMEDPRNISYCAHLLFCSKNVERIGDHATNIAETVYLSGHRRSAAGRTAEGRAASRRRRLGGDRLNETRRDPARAAASQAAAHPRRRGRGRSRAAAELQSRSRGLRRRDASSAATRPNCGWSKQPPDLVILDWMLPGVSGLEICRRLRAREATRTLPVIMLTARGEETERVRGLSVGADDYVVKPFSVPELMARVRALLRRSRPERIAERLVAGDLDLDRETRRVRRGARDLHLGPTEFRLLEYLLERPGRVFSRAQLLDGVWGQAVEIDERTVDVHIGRLRKALSRGRERDPIRTVRGAGYSFDETYGKG